MKQAAILLVDDEPEILNSVYRSIRKWSIQAGLHILTVESAEAAEQIVQSEDWEVRITITDQRMPGKQGDEFVVRLREIEPDAVPIVLTGYTDAADIEKLLNSEIFAYILKPWNTERLILELSKALKMYHLKVRERKARQHIEQELKMGALFQKALQHNVVTPRNKDIDFFVDGQCASKLNFSGDYYDIIELDNNRYLALVGDVAGHGLNTAFMGGILKSIIYPEFIKPFLASTFSPSRFLHGLNSRILAITENLPDMLVSFSAALIDVRTRTLNYSNAGLPPAVVVRDGKVSILENRTMPLGTSPKLQFEERKFVLEKGDCCVFYTDGLHPSGNSGEGFTEQNLFSVFSNAFSSCHSDARCHETVFAHTKKLLHTDSFEDDVTLLSCVLK
ncbi:MAG: fused response regulator/phosphatase [Spirochaetaceae bacterium]|nr:fused response regulator/phosphatase [Spirochaetaceae bacterium]MCF7947155.1 fused response regulator/phosphatase [Spirochaetia bacterium]MCF7950020.1 fused response regulator/phosphatase [Spirochaetaceae bacterium]